MQPTRRQIVDILKYRGRATVDELSKELGITLMAVRLHLVVLERDGLVSRSSLREGPGRPTLVYRLTEEAEEVFAKSYDSLAEHLLGAIKGQLGAAAAEGLCVKAAQAMAPALRERMGAGSVEKKVDAFARARSGQGEIVTAERADGGMFIHTYSCPYYRVARTHREACVLHRHLLREVLGAEVAMVSCQLEGDPRCSFLVQAEVPAPATPAGREMTETVDAALAEQPLPAR